MHAGIFTTAKKGLWYTAGYGPRTLVNASGARTCVLAEHYKSRKGFGMLQAMDRAHRLGQRRAVSVYRLLVRGTLEERIMGLQRFKLDVAAAVVNADNASLASLDTSGLLDLFAPPGAPCV